ncbi:hypothetical protein TNCV_3899941 [Trichonephila clavipes]|nr:hypothetical protein TNCV_3899941 [Trichonephila clavipes]
MEQIDLISIVIFGFVSPEINANVQINSPSTQDALGRDTGTRNLLIQIIRCMLWGDCTGLIIHLMFRAYELVIESSEPLNKWKEITTVYFQLF